MTKYIIKHVSKFDVYRIDGEHEILEKIFDNISEVETYIILKNGIIIEYIDENNNKY
jgi:hypothetical protein